MNAGRIKKEIKLITEKGMNSIFGENSPGANYIPDLDIPEADIPLEDIIPEQFLNEDINLAYQYYKENKLDFAIFAFKKAVEKYPDYPFGKFYIDLIQVYIEKNDVANAKIWYNKLKSSNFIDKNEVLHQLQNAAFYNQLVF